MPIPYPCPSPYHQKIMHTCSVKPPFYLCFLIILNEVSSGSRVCISWPLTRIELIQKWCRHHLVWVLWRKCCWEVPAGTVGNPAGFSESSVWRKTWNQGKAKTLLFNRLTLASSGKQQWRSRSHPSFYIHVFWASVTFRRRTWQQSPKSPCLTVRLIINCLKNVFHNSSSIALL